MNIKQLKVITSNPEMINAISELCQSAGAELTICNQSRLGIKLPKYHDRSIVVYLKAMKMRFMDNEHEIDKLNPLRSCIDILEKHFAFLIADYIIRDRQDFLDKLKTVLSFSDAVSLANRYTTDKYCITNHLLGNILYDELGGLVKLIRGV